MNHLKKINYYYAYNVFVFCNAELLESFTKFKDRNISCSVICLLVTAQQYRIPQYFALKM